MRGGESRPSVFASQSTASRTDDGQRIHSSPHKTRRDPPMPFAEYEALLEDARRRLQQAKVSL